jgi:hypothetical protein
MKIALRRKDWFLICLLTILMFQQLHGQLGGQQTYQFLNLSQSARTTALGGSLLSVADDDVALAYSNPALLNPSIHTQLSLNHNFHFADIQHGFINYGHHLDSLGLSFHVGINYINYGDFLRTDEFGIQQGNFDAKETAITIGASKMYEDRLRFGMNLKLISSKFDAYSSLGLAADLGVYYHNPEKSYSLAAVIKSVGTQLSTYNGLREKLPLEIQIGFSKKLSHLPFRFSIIAHNLQQWGVRYDDPNQQAEVGLFGEVQEENSFSTGIDNFFRHFIFNGEFLFGKKENFRLRFGYNHLRRKELSVSEFRSLGGFSLGFGLKIKKFRIDYGVGYYHLAGGVNHLSLSTNLKEFKKKI